MTIANEAKQTVSIDLNGHDYVDRVLGCWQGKNAGGTLGTPLETAWGQDEPFDVWWYPELKEGGLPNDDLEMQLVWLKALEEIGPTITARDLSRYWLDHIGYNFDEYGLSKLNLKWGLEPPLSGHHNNWFIDCMGSPIRSEIWACVAPGAPRLAARYAYEDAICDHAGGEGVYGELFNAALESAAFVVQDKQLLIDIALSYVPEDCMVRRAVVAAKEAFDSGVDWKQARRRVLQAAPHYNAQYSPINTGFQVIGLLYGHDFGEGICITVNCGYDTDSSGAAIGSYLGIIDGSESLPQKWVEPLGRSIATNQYWGGVKHLDVLPNPVPGNLDDLLERIRVAARRVLTHHGLLAGSTVEIALADLYADDGIRELHGRSPNVVPFVGPDLDIAIDYHEGAVVVPGTVKRVSATLRNRRVEPLEVSLQLAVPTGWDAPDAQRVHLPAQGEQSVEWQLAVPGTPEVAQVNTLQLVARITGRPAPRAVPIVLLGAFAVRLSEVFEANAEDPLATSCPPEADLASTDPQHRPGAWTDYWAHGYEQPVADGFDRPGVLYLQTFVKSPSERQVWVVLDPSCPARYWVNGVEVGSNAEYRLIRPNQKSADGIGGFTTLREGWNEVLVKLVHDGRHAAPQLHLGFSGPAPLNDHQFDLDRTALPWGGTQA
jgi:ADP-ribosylglycohydrolase